MSDWIEIKKGCEMPKSGHDVLIARDHRIIDKAYHYAEGTPIDGWYRRGSLTRDVTHWMPLPALPETGGPK